MPTRNVVLTDHNERVIEDLVRTGRYQNASEVLRAGLRLIEREENEHAAKLKALREAADVGRRDIAAGRFDLIENDEDLEEYIANLSGEDIGGH
ncbi:type II toxin-antitoxin system ParD family antitoxin [Nitrospirillum sp. BR 11164]|uniref:type II toxin-antitoxin system ParD family antitoxin n=1 Tax=Nitrospirillum sp. BR 11164 TaxID=3104324 RepID=UPI002AFE081B|nr:type II toxin-antitoxin system ParD family antitoxin [Nitrospirillum sp. BR 11164]MEA1649259.1 type II toxin-antitoxin system ParD family antitoxin [Nitrospirillum sp. BR 11164]